MTPAASAEALAPEGLAATAGPLEQIADFLARACQADELDERLDLAGATGPAQRVADTLNAFLDKLWVAGFQLSAKQEMLEKVVEIRTAEVHEILDNVNTGFLLTLRDEEVFDNFSRSCVDIFGVSDLKGRKLSELMGLDERGRAHFSLCYQQIFEDFLPAHVSVGQLPSEFSRAGRTYSIQGTPIMGKDGLVARVFFTINDTTEIRKLEAENALRQALIEIVRQKETFRAFLHETSRAFQGARDRPSQVRYRNLLHTTKGNLGCYGLHDIAGLVHSIEDAPEITARHLQSVEDTLKKFMQVHRAIIGLDYPEPEGARNGAAERLRPFLDALILEESRSARAAAAEDCLRKLSWVTAGVLLAPLRGLVERVGKRLEKDVSLAITGQDVLVDPQQAGTVFSNLGHLVRNSLDHGLEAAAERGAKPPYGQLRIACRESRSEWILEVADDGRGIDVDAVAAAAVAQGKVSADAVAALSHEERLRLILLDGVTTRDVATIDSGRGVGTAALLDSVEACGGKLEIASRPGEGTTFTVRIPRR
jgi:signal transduction histidine kinase